MSLKKNGQSKPEVVDTMYHAPEKETVMEFFYNPKKGTILGRDAKNWGQLMLFYAIFYVILAALFTICLQGLFSTLTENEPKWKLTSSLIGTNPGMGFRPLSEETERGSVIQFDTKKPEEGRYWIKLLDEFFKDYKSIGKKEKFCSFNQTHDPSEVCVVDTDSFGPCSPEQGYGYSHGRPCVFLKLNKIFNWVPEFIDDVATLPTDMPPQLNQHIANTTEAERRQIWVSCGGQHAVDKERLGDVKYYPQQGFPFFYYPYRNQKGYLSPLIAVQFEKVSLNEMVNVECRAWARNIDYSGSIRDRQGSVSFQLFID